MSTNIAARLQELGRTQPHRLALVARERRVTYEEMAGRTAAFAAGLAARGIQRGDRVLLLLPMSVELYVALLGCSHLGAAAVFLDAWSDRRRLDAAIRRANPRAFVGVPAAQLFRLVSPALRAVPLHLPVGRGFPLERLERSQGVSPPADVRPEEHALVTFTTGTTGAPKAAGRSHAFLWAQHRALTAHLRPERWDVDMPVLPIFVLNNLAGGITTVLPDFDPRRPDRFDPRSVRAQMEREGVTTASGSPAFFDRLARAGHRLPLRELFVGGAPVLPPQARRLQQATEGTVHVVYGSTEAEPISGLTVAELLDAQGEGLCVGRPVRDIAVRLDPQTEEVQVAGEHVLSGYLDNPEEDRRFKIHEGGRVWHRTGDGGRWDDGGRLWLQGRLSGRSHVRGRPVWEMPAVVRAVAAPGITHAALLPESTPEGPRSVLVVEGAGRPPQGLADRVVHVREIPRDPRHRSRTEVPALRDALLAQEGVQAWLVRTLRRTPRLPLLLALLPRLPGAFRLDRELRRFHREGLPVLRAALAEEPGLRTSPREVPESLRRLELAWRGRDMQGLAELELPGFPETRRLVRTLVAVDRDAQGFSRLTSGDTDSVCRSAAALLGGLLSAAVRADLAEPQHRRNRP